MTPKAHISLSPFMQPQTGAVDRKLLLSEHSEAADASQVQEETLSHSWIAGLLDIPDVTVLDVELTSQGVCKITVESTLDSTRCRKCGGETDHFYNHGPWIELRHLPIFGHPVYIRLRPKRYQCPDCDRKTTTQKLSWYVSRSPHTHAYNRHLLRQLVNSTLQDVSMDVSIKEGVGYAAIEGVIERYLQAGVNWHEFAELGVLGVDEIALKKGRRHFAAIITTQQADGHVAVLAVLPDRKKETVRRFFESIPAHLRTTIRQVCTDLWDGYIQAALEFNQTHEDVALVVVADRFHIAQNYRRVVDEIRKQETRRLKQALTAQEYEAIKGAMWPVRRNNRDLTPQERVKLNRLLDYSPDLKVAYTLREELTAIFELPLTKVEAEKRLTKWAEKVRRTGLTAFNTFMKTLAHYMDLITNYFVERLSSGFVEGLNNKIKTMKRRCYGIPNVNHLFQRIYLDLEGYRRFA